MTDTVAKPPQEGSTDWLIARLNKLAYQHGKTRCRVIEGLARLEEIEAEQAAHAEALETNLRAGLSTLQANTTVRQPKPGDVRIDVPTGHIDASSKTPSTVR